MKLLIFTFISLVFFGTQTAYSKTITLTTEMSGELAFIGADGTKNPTLELEEGDIVELVLQNGNGGAHLITVPELNVKSGRVDEAGEKTTVKFVAKKGAFTYFCPLPGHRRLGMEGKMICRHK